MTPPRPAPLLLAAALAAGLAVAGCAGPGGAVDGRGERSGQIRLGTPISAPTASGARDFVIRAFADCAGDPCRAGSYRLVFSNVGQAPLNASFTGVALEVDGRTYSWDNGERDFLVLPNTYGEFLSVSVPRVMFEDVATAGSVRIVLGDYEFYLSPGKRSTLADLAERTAAP